MPPHRHRPTTRRPAAAGRQDPTDAAGQPARAPHEPLVAGPEVARSGRRVVWVAALVGLSAVLVIALGLAAWFRGETNQLSGSAAASNAALVDVRTTAQVTGQVRDAVQRVFSYDFARLDDNERAAGNVITGPFAKDFHQQFARVRELVPRPQALVVATVPALAVKVLDGDRAIVVVFVDQQANQGPKVQQPLAAVRLMVTAERIDGSWKISDVEPF
ncbi:MAG TPA: hypothetical protein VIY28_00815 [Pseudonocardiaceae bacterium]